MVFSSFVSNPDAVEFSRAKARTQLAALSPGWERRRARRNRVVQANMEAVELQGGERVMGWGPHRVAPCMQDVLELQDAERGRHRVVLAVMEALDMQGRQPHEVVAGEEVIEDLEEVLGDREVTGDLEEVLTVL